MTCSSIDVSLIANNILLMYSYLQLISSRLTINPVLEDCDMIRFKPASQDAYHCLNLNKIHAILLEDVA